MTDREYAECLVERARGAIDVHRKGLVPPDNADQRMAPHVAYAKVKSLRVLARKLNALADLADCECP